MTWRRFVSLSLALGAAACAAVEEPAGPPPFEGVKGVALVRWREDEAAARPKDPLDALKESLDARGYRTRVVDLGRRVPADLRAVARLHDRVGALARRARPRAQGDRLDRLGSEAGAAARALGVDAIALYHRGVDWGPAPAVDPSPFPTPGFPTSVAVRRPVGALSLVAAGGAAATFAWGAGGEADAADASAPVNAAEAIDALLRVLSGTADEER